MFPAGSLLMDGLNAAACDGSPAITPVSGPSEVVTPLNEFQLFSNFRSEEFKQYNSLVTQKGYQDKHVSVLAASVVAAQGAVSVLVGALGDARDEQATAVQAAAQADLVKDAVARQTEIALEANKAAFEALSATEAVVDVKTAATTRLAAELAACRAVLARAVSAHDTFSRTLQETLAKLSDAVRLRERFDGAAGASKEEGADGLSPFETGMIAALDQAEAAGPNAAVASAQAVAVAEVAEDDAGAAVKHARRKAVYESGLAGIEVARAEHNMLFPEFNSMGAVAEYVAGENAVADAVFAAVDPVAAKHVTDAYASVGSKHAKRRTAAGAASAAPAKAKARAAKPIAKSVAAVAAVPAKAKATAKVAANSVAAAPAKVKPAPKKKPAPKPNGRKGVVKPGGKPAAKVHGRGPPPAAADAPVSSAGKAAVVSRLKSKACAIKDRQCALFAQSAANPPVGQVEVGRFLRASSALYEEALIVDGALGEAMASVDEAPASKPAALRLSSRKRPADSKPFAQRKSARR